MPGDGWRRPSGLDRKPDAAGRSSATERAPEELRPVLAEVGPAWVAGREVRLHARRGGRRRRPAGAGEPLEPCPADRLVITLVHLRTGFSRDALAVAFGVAPSTVTRGRSDRSRRRRPARSAAVRWAGPV
ncbi:transposase family protein [Catellatospora bangladeshensis]|uniref:transposase family protein n=1 Tax=Catellatospora bangladeshensis TaxID=310355 RepID=UPI0035712987